MISTATGGRTYAVKVAGSASGNIPGAGLYFYDQTGTGIVMAFDTTKRVNIYNGLAVTGALSSTGMFSLTGGSLGQIAIFNSTNANGIYHTYQTNGTAIGDIGSSNQTMSGSSADFGITSRSGKLIFGTGSSIRAVIDSSGNVGIGTTSPATKLHVNNGEIYVQNTDYGRVMFVRGSTNIWAVGPRNTDDLYIRREGGSANVIFDGGNVGIGTSTITKRLHIYSGEQSVGASQFNLEGYIGGYGAGLTFTSLLSSTSTLKEMARITADGEAAWNATASTQDAGLRFYTTSQGTTAERVRINAYGNVGIGTNTIADIAGGTSRTLEIYGGASGGGSFLHITNSTTGQTTLDGLVIGISGGASDALFIQREAANIIFRTDNTERVRIGATGNVGIGTTSPAARLDVSGSAAFGVGSTTGFGITLREHTTGTVRNWSIRDDAGVDRLRFSRGSSDAAFWDVLKVSASDQTADQFWYTNGAQRMQLSSAGLAVTSAFTVTGGAAIGGAALSATGNQASQLIANLTSSISGAGTSFGLRVAAGTNASDYALRVLNQAGTLDYLFVKGDGAVNIPGSLSKGSGSFRIEHPLPSKSETHELVHSFIEGPQADLIYRGKATLVNGAASVNIDTSATMTEGTFEALCREVQCFTTNESGWTAIRGKVTGNILTIQAQDSTCTDEISWMVIGERKDKHMMDTEWTDENGKVIVEPLKPIKETAETRDV
jgi:hypothetical protein